MTELYDKLREVIGSEPAATSMEILPPMSSSDIATTNDVEHVAVALRGDMAELGSELRGEMTELRSDMRTEMTELRTDLTGQMIEVRSDLRGEMHLEFGALRADFGALRGEFRASTRHTIITIVAAALTIWLTFYVPTVL